MTGITIDGKAMEAPEGATIMEAAATLGIVIPAMCHYGDLPHFASCMMCVVKEESSGRLLTSCSVRVQPGMRIITSDDEIREARKTALDLLLSDHVGDCEAPCQLSCPAHMDIPLMNRLLSDGKFTEAYEVVMEDIPLPSILGRICPAPCEGACRRKGIDGAVSICLLKRYAGDEGSSHVKRDALNVKRDASRVTRHEVAVVGSGPHGLSAAWYLRQFGYGVTVFDRNPLPGGALRYSVPKELLPEAVLDAEIDRIKGSGVVFELEAEINSEKMAELEQRFDAVVKPLDRSLKMAIRASALGKEAAWKVRQRLEGEPETGEYRMFNSRFGRLQEPEFSEYLKLSVPGERIEPAGGLPAGMTRAEVMAEAARCLHCECLKADNCLLRIYGDEYQAEQKRFQGPERKPVTKETRHDLVVYEPQKCIKCGICVRITSQRAEEYGLTFIGRGFDVVVGVPFNESISAGLAKTAGEAADACPTGALARRYYEQK